MVKMAAEIDQKVENQSSFRLVPLAWTILLINLFYFIFDKTVKLNQKSLL
jgi:hypothetical protein